MKREKGTPFPRMALPLLAALLLTACGSAKAPASAVPAAAFDAPLYDWSKEPQETVVLWTRELDMDRVYMQRGLERYRQLTGSRVEIVTFPQDTFSAAVAEAFATGAEPPDLLLSYGGTNIEPFDPDENFYDFSNAPWVKDLTAASINQTVYHGKVIGLPHWESSISGTLYNKKLFERYGIPVPETQAEFMAACQTLLENGVTPLYLPCETASMLLYQFPLDTVLEDPALLAGLNDGTLSYSDLPQLRTIVEWYRTMAQQGYLGEDYLQNSWAGMDAAMAGEQYGMMLCWDTWLYTDFTGDAASFGLMPAFVGVPETGTFEGPNQALLIVNRHSPRLKAALNLITFFADPYNYNAAFSGIYTAPAFRNQTTSISTPQYLEAERCIEDHFRDSIAWLRVRGFSQMDATCILRYMTGEPGYTVERCLADMDALRRARVDFPAAGDRGNA